MPDARGRVVTALEQAGGLVGRQELARTWGVSRQRIAQLVTQPGFPAAVGRANGGDVWLLAECEAWRAGRRGPGRPRNAGQSS